MGVKTEYLIAVVLDKSFDQYLTPLQYPLVFIRPAIQKVQVFVTFLPWL